MSLAIIPCQTIANPYPGPFEALEGLIKSETTTVEGFNEKRASLPDYNLFDGGYLSCTAFSKASSLGNVDLIQFIYKQYGPKILGIGDLYGRTALHYAAAYRNMSSIYALISLRTPINIKTVEDYTPREEILPAGATALDIALRTHKISICVLLILNGGVVNLPAKGDVLISLISANDTIKAARTNWPKLIDYALDTPIFADALLRIIADYALEI
jgi:ankyrin repeat protein